MKYSPRHELVHVIQGQYKLTDRPEQVLSTLLGSCVAACMRDHELGIGGMNHFLLPGNDPNSSQNVKYGAHSMEQLVNALLRRGAKRDRIEVQLFGGANIVKGLTRIGDANADFARQFVRDEGFRLTGSDLGGTFGRKVKFFPSTGRAEVEPINSMPPEAPPKPKPKPVGAVQSGDVDLF